MDGPALLRTTGLASLAFGLNVFCSIPAMAGWLLADGNVYDHPDHVVQSSESSFRGGTCDDTCLNLWRSYCVNRRHKLYGSSLHRHHGCGHQVGLSDHCKSCELVWRSDCAHGHCAPTGTSVQAQPPLEDLNLIIEPTEAASTDLTPSSQKVPTGTSKSPLPATVPLSRAIAPAPEPTAADGSSHSTQTSPTEASGRPARVPNDEPTTKENKMEPEIPKNILPFGLDNVGIDVPFPPMPTVNNNLRTASKQGKSTGMTRLIEQLNQAGRTR